MDLKELDLKHSLKEIRRKYNRWIVILIIVVTALPMAILLFGVRGIDALALYQLDVWNNPPILARKWVVALSVAIPILIFSLLPILYYPIPGGKSKIGLRKDRKTKDGVTNVIVYGDKRPQFGVADLYREVFFNWSYWAGNKANETEDGHLHIQTERVELDMIIDLVFKGRKWESRYHESERIRRQEKRQSVEKDSYWPSYGRKLGRGAVGGAMPPIPTIKESVGDEGPV